MKFNICILFCLAFILNTIHFIFCVPCAIFLIKDIIIYWILWNYKLILISTWKGSFLYIDFQRIIFNFFHPAVCGYWPLKGAGFYRLLASCQITCMIFMKKKILFRMKRWSYIENYVNFSHSTPEPPYQLNLALSILERPYLFPKKDNAE